MKVAHAADLLPASGLSRRSSAVTPALNPLPGVASRRGPPPPPAPVPAPADAAAMLEL